MDVILGLLVVLVAAVVVFSLVLYVWPGAPARGEAGPGDEWGGRFLVRTYVGRQQGDVMRRYVSDAEALASRGYEPVGQSWGDGQWDTPVFLLALILSLFGIGLILLAYMAIMRPPGTLAVTYRRSAG